MADLATIGLVCRSRHDHEAALTTNLRKALFFDERARTTQNRTRRERYVRAARRYALATANEPEASFRSAAPAAAVLRSGSKKKETAACDFAKGLRPNRMLISNFSIRLHGLFPRIAPRFFEVTRSRI